MAATTSLPAAGVQAAMARMLRYSVRDALRQFCTAACGSRMAFNKNACVNQHRDVTAGGVGG
jgi:hypothetical protein